MRAYWKDKFTGEGTPPTCGSLDGLIGVGEPGGACVACPLGQFGSGSDAAGKPNDAKACKEGRLLFVLRPQDTIPIIISLSTMSVKPCKKYFLQLAQAAVPYYGCVTEFGLTPTKNKGGITYSQATFKAVRRLEPEQVQAVRATMKGMGAVFQQGTTIHETEYSAE